MTRYFLSIGVPFERWMQSLAALVDPERDPDKFVIVAAHEMAGLPWLSRIGWQSKNSTGNTGEITKYSTELTFGGLALRLYTRCSPSPALVLHIRLLARLLGNYYDAKICERERRRNAYVQAIYETGSRLTHDVKNLLQNALEKRKMASTLRIVASLQWHDGFVLSVCDDGDSIPDTLVAQLFVAPVLSNSGLGVGLYQVARFAREQGFEVSLSSNVPGKICFTLALAKPRSA